MGTMTTFKNIYTWVCIADAVLLLALGVMWATGLMGNIYDAAHPNPNVAGYPFSLEQGWKGFALDCLMFGCPASVFVLWLGYLMFVWDGKFD